MNETSFSGRCVALVQARTSSTRLPGKVLADIGGKPMLERVARRAGRASRVDELVIATTTAPEDDAIVREAERLELRSFRGSAHDVLDRFARAAAAFDADVVVRITADCPLIDPDVVDAVIGALLDSEPPADIAANVLERTYPRGLDVEVVRREALAAAARAAVLPYQRSHVTPYLYEHPESFRAVGVCADRDFSGERWTVDTREDLLFIREVYERLLDPDAASWLEVLDVLSSEPGLRDINADVVQKGLHEG